VTSGRKLLIGGGVVLALGVVVAASLLGESKSKKGTEVYQAKAARRDLVSTVSATGRIEPKVKVEVQSAVMGEIVTMPVKEGDRVRRGDLLVQIDPARYRAAADSLDASLRMSRIEISRQEATLAQARNTLKRSRELHAQGILAPDLLEKSELEVRTGEIILESLREQVERAQYQLAEARDDLRKTTIISPIDGAVTQRNAELGEMTLVGTMNNPGTVLMTVSDMSEILAEIDVDETRIVQVTPGQKATVIVDAVGETHPYAGTVVEIAGTAVQRPGQDVRVFPVKVALDDPDERLRPGMSAQARIETQREANALVVPIQAVLLKTEAEFAKVLAKRDKAAGNGKPKEPAKEPAKEPEPEAASAEAATPSPTADTPPDKKDAPEGSREVVFRIVDDKAVMVVVKTGTSDETDVTIVDGLSEGDVVAIGPYRALKKLGDGDAVREKSEKDGDGSEDGKDEEEGESAVQVEVD